jgi:hypothetical protein
MRDTVNEPAAVGVQALVAPESAQPNDTEDSVHVKVVIPDPVEE